jgi:hypothetical protein
MSSIYASSQAFDNSRNSRSTPQEDSDDFINDLVEETSTYFSILVDDVVAAARHLVVAIPASGQRREGFATVIADGNKAGIFGPEGLREIVLLKDMDVEVTPTDDINFHRRFVYFF